MREFKASKSGRKPHLSARELILKLAGFSHMVHLSFPLHTNSPALQMEKPALLWHQQVFSVTFWGLWLFY